MLWGILINDFGKERVGIEMNPYLKITLGILLSVLVIGFIVVWDLYLKDNIMSEEVVIVKPDVQLEAKDTIQREHLAIEKRRINSLVEGTVTAEQIDEVVGHDSAVPLVGNAILSTKYIDFDDVVPDAEKGEAIRPIPEDWIYAKPGSLRRKDRIDIYAIESEEIRDFQANMERLHQEPSDESDDESKEEDTVSSSSHQSKLPLEDRIHLDIEPILTNVPVVYAKDASNREVVGETAKGESEEQDSRLDASGRISDLEVNLNSEDFKTLMGYINDGYQLYITYN